MFWDGPSLILYLKKCSMHTTASEFFSYVTTICIEHTQGVQMHRQTTSSIQVLALIVFCSFCTPR